MAGGSAPCGTPGLAGTARSGAGWSVGHDRLRSAPIPRCPPIDAKRYTLIASAPVLAPLPRTFEPAFSTEALRLKSRCMWRWDESSDGRRAERRGAPIGTPRRDPWPYPSESTRVLQLCLAPDFKNIAMPCAWRCAPPRAITNTSPCGAVRARPGNICNSRRHLKHCTSILSSKAGSRDSSRRLQRRALKPFSCTSQRTLHVCDPFSVAPRSVKVRQSSRSPTLWRRQEVRSLASGGHCDAWSRQD